MKKKVFSIFCAALLVCSMSVTAFAAEGPNAGNTDIDSLNGNTEISVNIAATLVEEQPSYSVNVEWENMTFTYTDVAKTWSTSTHTWSADAGDWNAATSDITVINHSSAAVDVAATYAAKTSGEFEEDTAYKGVTIGLEDFATKQLQAGDLDNIDGVDGDNMATAQLSVSGTPTENIADATVGTVTVTVTTGTYAG